MTGPGLSLREQRILGVAFIAAVLGMTVRHMAPATGGWSTWAFDLALVLGGFASTRLLSATSDRREGLWRAWSYAARWAGPAMILVCVAVLAGAVLLLPPIDLRDQARTALWTSFGLSGLELMKQGPYAPQASSELLLHVWIVGVAGQLFLGWSLLVTALGRSRPRLLTGLAVAGGIASLGLDLWLLAHAKTQQALFLAPAQAWPFLAGALAARLPGGLGPLDISERGPGEPILRAAALALPFYLWSWPLLAFPGLVLARPLTLAESAVALAAAVLLAWVTHRWVETPVRRRPGHRPVSALRLTAVALGTVGVAGAVLLAFDGLPGRAPAAVLAEEAGVLRRPPLQALCNTEGFTVPDPDRCTVPAGAAADVVLWGNSHADHLSPAVLAWAQARGLGVRQASRSGCPPLLRARAGLADEACLAFNRAAVAEWGREKPRIILLGAGWTVVLDRAPGDPARALDALADELRHTLRVLRAEVGPRTLIVLLGSTPDYRFAPGACHARRAFLGLDTARCDLARPANADLAGQVDAKLAALAAGPGMALYRPWTSLCEGDLCRTRGAGGPWYADASHMTEAGGAGQAEALAAVLDSRFPRGP